MPLSKSLRWLQLSCCNWCRDFINGFRSAADESRGIFRFHDGQRWRRVDPIRVSICLDAIDGFHPIDTPQLLQVEEGAELLKTAEKVAEAVRVAFKVPQFDDGGLTTLECVNLLADFFDFTEGVKKNSNPTPTLLRPTASASSGESVSSSGSASGSTCSDPLSGTPGPSLGASEPPLTVRRPPSVEP